MSGVGGNVAGTVGVGDGVGATVGIALADDPTTGDADGEGLGTRPRTATTSAINTAPATIRAKATLVKLGPRFCGVVSIARMTLRSSRGGGSR
jgi:hypothetical protein